MYFPHDCFSKIKEFAGIHSITREWDGLMQLKLDKIYEIVIAHVNAKIYENKEHDRVKRRMDSMKRFLVSYFWRHIIKKRGTLFDVYVNMTYYICPLSCVIRENDRFTRLSQFYPFERNGEWIVFKVFKSRVLIRQIKTHEEGEEIDEGVVITLRDKDMSWTSYNKMSSWWWKKFGTFHAPDNNTLRCRLYEYCGRRPTIETPNPKYFAN